jgi:hypothetical protein
VSTPQIRLGGQTLGGTTTYGWDLGYGVQPIEQVFVLTTERAVTVPLGVALTLEITNVRKPLRVDHVYALEVGAGPNPRQRALKLADRRWLWSSKWVSSAFNVRRASGDTSLVTEAGQPIELAQIETTIRYAKWSLDPPQDGAILWTARRVLEFVFQQIDQPYRIEASLPDVPIVDLYIEDNGAAAVERVLSYLPGADVYIDLDGTAVVQNCRRGGDGGGGTTTERTPDGAPLLPTMGKKHVALGGDGVVTNRKAIRPGKVVALFTPEVEVRFDSVAEGGTRTRDTPALVNVAPSPDLTVTLSSGQTVARGTYVALETLFTTWGAFGLLAEALSTAKMAEYGTGAAILEQLYARTGSHLYDPVSAGRVRAAVDHWRRTYQIDERFVQRLVSIRANRVAIVDPIKGTRARSEVYCDFLRRPNKKNPRAKGEIEGSKYGWYDRGYAALLADAVAAPATISVLSETAGLVRVEPKLDPWGTADAIILGFPFEEKVPTNTGLAEANRTGVDAFAQWQRCKLTTDFQVATVLTVVPASPNTIDRFHKVEIAAGAAGSDGTGPTVYVRIFPQVMTARFAWSDDQAESIKGAILRGDPRPEALMVNKRDVDSVALAAAQAIYANLADTPDTSSGPVSVDMNPDLKPTGAIGRVRHGLNNGLTTSLVYATGFRRPVDLWRFLPADVRRTVLRNGQELES